MTQPTYVLFTHGLGDCANFILVVRAYRELGYDVRVVCDPNKKPFFDAAGIPNVDRAAAEAKDAKEHPWWEPGGLSQLAAADILAQNKIWRNFKSSPLPPITQSREQLWTAVLRQQNSAMFEQERASAAEIVSDLPRPILLMHANGNTSPREKDLPENFPVEISSLFLRDTPGSVIFLDWDNRTNWVHSSRTRHINYHYGARLNSSAGLMGLMAHADLLLGIDSGPLHTSGLIDMPAICVWNEHHPLRYALPRANCLNIATKCHIANLWGAHEFNIVEKDRITAEYIFSAILRFLSPSVFPLPRGEDVQLQLLLEKCFGGVAKNTKHVSNSLVDRHRTFRFAFDHLIKLGRGPKIVETGCIRADNDWAGAGYSTFLLGIFAQRFRGSLLSIDITPANIKYAEKICVKIPAVNFAVSDSVAAINALEGGIDLFYLDSMDANIPGHAEHGLKEAQASAQKIAADGLIVFDDTINEGGKFLGKGELGIPWLLDNGWKILMAGHQIVLGRVNNA
jgi:hypothetical protein